MNFNSLPYLIFLPLTVALYYALPQRLRNPLLLVLSYVFYMCWKPVYALLILFSTAVTYLCGRLIHSRPRRKRLWLAGNLTLDDSYFLPMPVTPPLFGKDGIIVTYQQYEIAAYAAGMPSFVIPYIKAKAMMNNTGKQLIN